MGLRSLFLKRSVLLRSDDRRPRTDYRTKRSVLRPPSSDPVLRFLPAWWLLQGDKDPIPSRTRPSNALAPMVLCLKTWESRPSPGLQRTDDRRRRAENRRRRTEDGKSSRVPRMSLKSSSQPSSTLPRPGGEANHRGARNAGPWDSRPIRPLFSVPRPPASDQRGVEQPGSSSGS